MARDRSLTVHLSGSLKRDIEEMAAEAGMSKSKYARKVLKNHVTDEKADDIAREARAKEQIEEVASIATKQIQQEVEEFTSTAKAIQQLTARAGVYSVANFELNGQDFNDTYRRDALSTGARRLRKDLLENIDIDPEEIPEYDQADDSPGGRPWDTDEE